MRAPPNLVVVPVHEQLELFRVVRTNDRADPNLVDSFKSNYELGKPLRLNSPEGVYRMIWQGVSMFETLAAARSVGCRFPAMGAWVARVVLEPGCGASLAAWGSPYHVSVWCDSSHLLRAVVDIVPAQG